MLRAPSSIWRPLRTTRRAPQASRRALPRRREHSASAPPSATSCATAAPRWRPAPADPLAAAVLMVVFALVASGGIGVLTGVLAAIVTSFAIAIAVIWLTNLLQQ